MEPEYLTVTDYFTYQPTKTEERKEKHELINSSCLSLAQILERTIKDYDCRKMALFALQQCRMFANQGATVDELRQLAMEQSEKLNT